MKTQNKKQEQEQVNETTPAVYETKKVVPQEVIESLVLKGDLSKMDDKARVNYYKYVCDSLGLNSLTQPFQILKLNGKETLYATKDCTEQLRRLYGVSVIESNTQIEGNLCITKVRVQDNTGRYDTSTGVTVLPSESTGKANAIMKAETKAKRRATLSICGLGMLEESELDTVNGYETKPIEPVNIEQEKQVVKEETKNSVENQKKLKNYLVKKHNADKDNAVDILSKLMGVTYEKFPTDEKECSTIYANLLAGGNGNG